MKRLLLVLIALVSVSSAFAADLKVTGEMMVQGNMDRSTTDVTGFASSDKKADFLESNLTINAALVANENATVFVKLTYDNSDQRGVGSVQSKMAGEVTDGSASAADVGLAVERAYLNYKIAPFLQLNTGLMGGGKWSTNFGDTEINVPRVQLFVPLSKDLMFWGTYEKNTEATSTLTAGTVNLDKTSYYLSGIIGVGPIKIWPLLKYVTDDTATGFNKTTSALDLGLTGDFGVVGLAAEGIYAKVDNDGASADLTYMGGYVDVFAKLDTIKAGLAAFYTSADLTKGTYNTGDDLNFSIVVGDKRELNHPASGAPLGLLGLTAVKVYGEAKMDKLTVGGAFAYFMSTDDKVAANFSAYKYSAWEVDVTANYAFDANASYEIGAGYAGISYENSTGATTTEIAQYRVYNKFAIKF